MKINPALRPLQLLMLALVFCSIQAIPAAAAEERYVGDVMYVALRKAPGNQQEIIINGLASGSRLTFIREEQDNNKISWSLVRTTAGVLGWVRSQQLLSEPTAALQLPVLQEQYEKLLQDHEQLRQTSTLAVDIERENQRLNESYQLLQTRADVLQAENDKLKNTERYNQWVFGGGLLVCGIFISFLLQGLGRRKRQSEWR